MSIRATVLNCPIDLCDINFALQKSKEAIDNNENLHIITINPEMIMNAQKNKSFFEIVNSSDLNIVDGVGVKIALKIKGIKQEQIRGVDFSRSLVKLANENNYRLAFLGAKEEVIQKAKENFLIEYPNLNFSYVRNGYFQNDDEIIEEIKKAQPQILLVGLGSPRQEEFIIKLKESLKGCVFVGVGGSFDVFSGITKEAPQIYRKLGLEWLYRTISQPERFKRIFPLLPLFLIKCIISTILKKG
ncbi:MAG: WecB/TagA/CpsF family glycosyltransferase [Candidatus Gastranaerophilales bacterium]|nr:WecB/TagA/CpsF family glycosyltransferase [Candidatus Gastranaerophilales bacterium]